MKYPIEIANLIQFFKKFPGIGGKSAERFVFELLKWPAKEILHFSDAVREIEEKMAHCSECHFLIGSSPCPFCHNERRDLQILCVTSSSKDIFAIENTGSYRGLYHVLKGLLSPIHGQGIEEPELQHLKLRLATHSIQEVVLVLEGTLEGDATALYLKRELSSLKIKISRPALGLPIGTPIDYIDAGTLSRAITSRQLF